MSTKHYGPLRTTNWHALMAQHPGVQLPASAPPTSPRQHTVETVCHQGPHKITIQNSEMTQNASPFHVLRRCMFAGTSNVDELHSWGTCRTPQFSRSFALSEPQPVVDTPTGLSAAIPELHHGISGLLYSLHCEPCLRSIAVSEPYTCHLHSNGHVNDHPRTASKQCSALSGPKTLSLQHDRHVNLVQELHVRPHTPLRSASGCSSLT